MGALTGTKPTRAQLKGRDDGDVLNCQFNPETLTRSKSATITAHPSTRAQSTAPHQVGGAGPETLSVKLLFDRFDTLGSSDGTSVDDVITKVFSWLAPSQKTQSAGNPSPTVVDLTWGQGFHFSGHVRQASVQYTMFDGTGKTLRATITLSMQSVDEPTKGTNPTSGGLAGRVTAEVHDGDTLASISYAHYGDPNLWRAIAQANGIEDPRRVRVGTRVLLPPRPIAATTVAMTAGRHAGQPS